MITIVCECNSNSNEVTEDNTKDIKGDKEFTKMINESHSNVYFNRRYTNALRRKYGGASERIRLCIHDWFESFTRNISRYIIQFLFVLACLLIMALPVSLFFI